MVSPRDSKLLGECREYALSKRGRVPRETGNWKMKMVIEKDKLTKCHGIL